MNLNSNVLLSSVPSIDIERSRFDRKFEHTTTCNAGLLCPFLIDDCLPGTTVNFDTSFVCRMLTPLKPVMGDAVIDIFYFFTPYRLLWDHWREFMGENTSGYWAQETVYQIPHLVSQPVTGDSFEAKSLADHFGFPTDVNGFSVSQFPFRAYALIWNEFFRNQNTDNPTYFYKGDSDLNIGDYDYPLYGGQLLPVAREHDYFSDCLPTAQKLPNPVTVPFPDNYAPVITRPEETIVKRDIAEPQGQGGVKIRLHDYNGSALNGWNSLPSLNSQLTAAVGSQPSAWSADKPYFSNLWTDFRNVSLFTINSLRQAFAVQRYAERLALGGSRYTEYLQTFYGLSPQDARLQRPEFLGSQRFTINMSQVLQTSESGTTPQGNTAAYSLTGGSGAHVSYSTQEHGVLMGLFCIRHTRSYQQGINRAWSKRDLFDIYQPTFAHLSNMAVLNKEIFVSGDSETDNKVFGYQEMAAEYRYLPSVISGEMRSNYSQSLDAWHYGDYYQDTPTLSESWMAEGDSEIARTLALTDSSKYDQFLLQFHADIDTTAPLPLYSVPGLIDHF